MKLFYDSVAIFFRAWLGALTQRGRRLAPLGPARLLVLALFPLFLALQLLHALCLLLDHLLFPAFRRTRLERPVFVLGVPRSGTTFLHRELARDPAFTAPRTWEVVLAPALCQRYVVAVFARIDHFLGSPLRRGLDRLLGRAAGGIESVHAVGLTAAEEDYLALLPCAGCFFLHLLFPQEDAFTDLVDLDRLSPARRGRLLDHYHGLLQRQVYFHGGRQLLSKNAAFAGWTPHLAARYPKARFIFCIRKPDAALASQLTSLAGARRLFAAYPRDGDLQATFQMACESWWRTLEHCATGLSPAPLVVEQEWLRGHTAQVLNLVYAMIGRGVPPPLTGLSPAAPAGVRSAAWPLSAADIEAMRGPYQNLLAIAARQRSAAL